MKGSSRRSCVIFASIVTAMVVVTASSALAKGPESATLTGPGIDRPIELDTTNADLIGRAMEQTGLWWSESGDLPRPLEEPPGELGPAYTLTWVRYGDPGESERERAIRQVIYPFAEGGVTIHTPTQDDLRGVPEATGWFLAPALGDTLAALGVPVTAASSSSEARPPEVVRDASPERQPVGASFLVGLGLLAVMAVLVGARRTFRGLGRVRG
jgi:hypothetical protein